FFSSRRRHTRFSRDWSSDVCSSDLVRSQEEKSIFRSTVKVRSFGKHSDCRTPSDHTPTSCRLRILYALCRNNCVRRDLMEFLTVLRMDSVDRKSTRLNSSHVKNSYA